MELFSDFSFNQTAMTHQGVLFGEASGEGEDNLSTSLLIASIG
jgi:hypothetical protein